MNFTKFVKSLASTGVIYESDKLLKKQWLSSVSVMMAIPDTVRSVTASGIETTPETIQKIIDGCGYTTDANLTKAIMPVADGKIKDCVRIYQSENGEISLPISNDDYGLIDKSDITEILYHYSDDCTGIVSDALLIKKPGMMLTDDYELVGIIFPVIEY